jgi:hypothetical protein
MERKTEFIDHTTNWYKGENFEGRMLIIWGVLMVVLALYFWKFSYYDVSRVLVVPILVVGLFWGIAAGYGLIRNKQRLEKAKIEYKENPDTFIKNENKRVGGFFKYYRYLLPGWSVLIIIGLAVFIFMGGNQIRAIGIAIILFSVAGLMVDHTSEQNAKKYHLEIEKELLK